MTALHALHGTGEVAVITGGASGFGRALGALCAQRGLRVALLDLDGARAEAQAAELAEAHGVDTLGRLVDVASDTSVRAAVGAVEDRWGRADLVVSNVGVHRLGAVDALSDDEWRWVLDVNVVGSARVARGFLPLLLAAPRGRLAFTASTSVLDPASHMGAYQASKFAVWGLAETLRLELAPTGVSVSVIFPAGMMSRHLETSAAAAPDGLPGAADGQKALEAAIASNPAMAQDVVTPQEAAAATIDAVLAGRRYIVTHGDLVDAVSGRAAELRAAAVDGARVVRALGAR